LSGALGRSAGARAVPGPRPPQEADAAHAPPVQPLRADARRGGHAARGMHGHVAQKVKARSGRPVWDGPFGTTPGMTKRPLQGAFRTDPPGRGTTPTARRRRVLQSTCAPEALTTGAQFSTSDLMNTPNSAGVVFSPTAPRPAKAFCTSGLSCALTITAFSLSMTSWGVPAGAMSPNQD